MSFKAAPTASNAGHSKRLLVGSKRKLPRREGREHKAGPDRRTAGREPARSRRHRHGAAAGRRRLLEGHFREAAQLAAVQPVEPAAAQQLSLIHI